MPGPKPNPVEPDLTLPKNVDVVVIGGGIIGVSIALELAERGVSVLICEKGQIGAEQSSRNWGWVRLGMRDPREIPLMFEAFRIWQDLDTRVGAETGYTQSGIMFAASGGRSQGNLEGWLRYVDGYDTGAEMISAARVKQCLSSDQVTAEGGLYLPQDGRAEPQWVAPAIAEAARKNGASIMTNCAVRSLDIQAGRVAGVYTERGRVTCSQVVLAGGAWSRLLAGNAGIDLPQLKVLNTVLRTSPAVGGPETAYWSDHFTIRKRVDGGYTIAAGHENTVEIVPDSFRLGRSFLPAYAMEWKSLRFRLSRAWIDEMHQPRTWLPTDVTPFEHCRILDPQPKQKVLRRAWQAARLQLPALSGAEIIQSWAGMIDVTPDAIPVISGVDDVPGFHIATGFSGHGFGIGPGAGRLMADLVVGDTPCVDPIEFRLSRFTDGSIVRPFSGR